MFDTKLITCFINGFTSKKKPNLMNTHTYIYIYIYWILDLDNEVHSIWVIWTSNLQESKSHAKVGVSQGRDFPVLPLPTCPNACNARQGFLERPVVANAPPLLKS